MSNPNTHAVSMNTDANIYSIIISGFVSLVSVVFSISVIFVVILVNISFIVSLKENVVLFK